ncbi:MAG: hypothetical protein H6862_06575 [Rhodospirillales bacterium]|nr:hypothetical protein [Rhodospirillales bacterium]
MKTFFKENILLLCGIALPLILIGFFLVAGQIGKTSVPAPQYDLVFAVDYYKNSQNRQWDINLESGKIIIQKRKIEKDGPDTLPRLYVFNRRTLSAQRLDLDFDKTDSQGVLTDPLLENINKREILPGPIAPDGYRFEYAGNGGSGLLGEIFGMSRRRWAYALVNGARTIPVKGDVSIYNAEIIAWIKDSPP